MSNQSGRHAAVNDILGISGGTYEGSFHAMFDADEIASGTFNERLLAWLNEYLEATHTSLAGAQHAFALSLGFANWDSLNTWDALSGVYVPPTTNLAFDYDPGISANVTLNAGNVSAIANPTGADPALAQATANKQPLLVAANLNGYDVVRFDGTDSAAGDFMRAALTTAVAQPLTIYRVVNMIVYDGGDVIDDTFFTPGWTAANGSTNMTNGPSPVQITANAGVNLNNNTFAIGEWVIVTTVFNGLTSEVRKNKAAAVVGTAGTGTVGRYAIGGRGDDPGNIYGNFDWARSIGYRAAHDTATQDAIIDGLAAQYGLTV